MYCMYSNMGNPTITVSRCFPIASRRVCIYVFFSGVSCSTFLRRRITERCQIVGFVSCIHNVDVQITVINSLQKLCVQFTFHLLAHTHSVSDALLSSRVCNCLSLQSNGLDKKKIDVIISKVTSSFYQTINFCLNPYLLAFKNI